MDKIIPNKIKFDRIKYRLIFTSSALSTTATVRIVAIKNTLTYQSQNKDIKFSLNFD